MWRSRDEAPFNLAPGRRLLLASLKPFKAVRVRRSLENKGTPIDLIGADRQSGGFSLVEVALSLGILSFCLLSLVALLPVGLGELKNSRDEVEATQALEKISTAIRKAPLKNSRESEALWGYSNIRWSVGGVSTSVCDLALTSTGEVLTQSDSEKKLVARVEVRPPASSFTAGTALVSVAWPQGAKWDSASNKWLNAQGSVSSWLIFLPLEEAP